jgi:hypothetical protein
VKSATLSSARRSLDASVSDIFGTELKHSTSTMYHFSQLISFFYPEDEGSRFLSYGGIYLNLHIATYNINEILVKGDVPPY